MAIPENARENWSGGGASTRSLSRSSRRSSMGRSRTSRPSSHSKSKAANTKRYARYFREMLDRGIFLAPSQFEAAFVSAAHSEADIDRAVEAARQCLHLVANDAS